MNKLDCTLQGGDPFTLDNLEFMQNGLTEAIKGLLSAWRYGSSDSVVIAGIDGVISGANTIYSNGYIGVGDEIYFVQGGTFLTADYVVIDITPTFESSGDETFEDLTNQQTHIVRRGILKVSTGGPNEIDMADLISLKSRLATIGCVLNLSTAWTVVGDVGAPAFNLGWDNNSPGTPASKCRFRKTKIGEVEVTGIALKALSGTGGNIVFQLPAGYRPAYGKSFILAGNDDSGTWYNQVFVNSNGNISVFGTIGDNKVLYLDPIRFSLD